MLLIRSELIGTLLIMPSEIKISVSMEYFCTFNGSFVEFVGSFESFAEPYIEYIESFNGSLVLSSPSSLPMT